MPLDLTARAALSTALLAWYGQHARDLPWRRDPDPYRTWVSEIMLQQTRVSAVLEHFRTFTTRFPTALALALAAEEEVLALWSGLGYYRRARMLHRAAKFLLQEHEGTLPRTAAELRKLPGIGSYTAAAIASIAFGERIAVVDGNVERVLLRVAGRPEEGNRATEDFVHHFAQALIEAPVQPEVRLTRIATHPPGDHNQAMMELGATVCLPRAPRCLECPILDWCVTRGEHVTPARAVMKSERVAYALITRTNAKRGTTAVRLYRRAAGLSLMPGMLELPTLQEAPSDEPMLRLRHAIVGTNYYAEIFRVNPYTYVEPGADMEAKTEWYEAAQLGNLPLTGLARKVLQRAGIMATQVLPAESTSDSGRADDRTARVTDLPLLIGMHGTVSDGTPAPVIPTHSAGRRSTTGDATDPRATTAQGGTDGN